MTNERAIELLRRISDSQFDGVHGDERREALEMAVRALFSQQIVNDSQGLVNDCISRKMAIDEVKRLHDVAWANWKETRISANTMIDALKDLPSAQPETHDKRTETHSCDLINRQQAIDALNDEYHGMISDESMKIYQIINWISALPSAQPETAKRIVGKSRDGMTLWYQCDMCNEPVDAQDDFCRGCGRRLTDG